MKITLFYITTSGENEARALGLAAVKSRLAACANVIPIQSLYPWEGNIREDQESALLLKTIPELGDVLTSFILTQHTYTTPCILHWDVEVNDGYGQWIIGEVTQA